MSSPARQARQPYKREFPDEEGVSEEGRRVNEELFKWDSGVFRVFWNS